MILVYRFFKLPIYQRSYEEYYKGAENDKEKHIKFLESSWGKSYAEIPKHATIEMEDRYEWPPWEFNDIIGFVDIGMDPHDRLTGNIFLMRKYLPKNHHKNKYRKYLSLTEKRQIFYLCELSSFTVDWHKNNSYVKGISQILEEATRIIKKISKTKKYKWLLQTYPFLLGCIDFVKVASEIHPNFPNSKISNV
jgi:hypothetical protein